MSTKTLRKRIALVAVSALGFGLLSVVPSSAAGTGVAATTTGSAITGTVSPVRVTFGSETGSTSLDTVPYAKISWTAPHSLAVADTAIMTLTSAPSTAAFLQMTGNAFIGSGVNNGLFTGNTAGASLATDSRRSRGARLPGRQRLERVPTIAIGLRRALARRFAQCLAFARAYLHTGGQSGSR